MPESTAEESSIPSTSQHNAWERWIIIWHVVFYGSLILPTILALFNLERGSTVYPGLSPVLVLVLSLLLGVWYALIMVWQLPKAAGNKQVVWTIIYLTGAMIVWFPLARTNWAYFITASSFYGLMWGTLPFWLAVSGNVILTGVIIWVQALNMGKTVVISFNLIVIGAVVIGWAALLALWMRTIMRESAQRKQLIEQLEATQSNLVAAERQAGILQERQRMAGEIHDTLAQDFTSIIMQLEAADQAFGQDAPATHRHLNQARDTARSGLLEARRLVRALQPAPLEEASLLEALKRVTERWIIESGIETGFFVTGDPYPLPSDTKVVLLRALQEALTNIHKHAHAQLVSVTISYMDDQVSLDVNDDGIGFDLEYPDGLHHSGEHSAKVKVDTHGGFGLKTMRQRADQLGGSVYVESSPGKGTTLVVQLPTSHSLFSKSIP